MWRFTRFHLPGPWKRVFQRPTGVARSDGMSIVWHRLPGPRIKPLRALSRCLSWAKLGVLETLADARVPVPAGTRQRCYYIGRNLTPLQYVLGLRGAKHCASMSISILANPCPNKQTNIYIYIYIYVCRFYFQASC